MDRNILALYQISTVLNSMDDSLFISSSELGDLLGVSQQTASRYLIDLEKNGLIKRMQKSRKQNIMMTEKGIDLLNEIYLNLDKFFRKMPVTIEGDVVSGIGDGAYYVKKYRDKIEKKIGVKPFFGTLNLRVKKPFTVAGIKKYASGEIRKFREGGRVFGGIEYMPVKIRGKKWSHNCFLVFPNRTHHKSDLEIISEVNLRKRFRIKDGDIIKVEMLRSA